MRRGTFRLGRRANTFSRTFGHGELLEPRLALSVATAATASQAGVINYPDGVTVTPTQVITETDTIPRFVANPTITTIKSGNWSDPTIWSLGRVPTTNDLVEIPQGINVAYTTVSSAHISGIEIDGSLVFSPTMNTQLIVGNMMVMPTGRLQIGAANQPIKSNVTAQLVIADQAIDPVNDPNQYGTGLIALGTVSIHGAPSSLTWAHLTVAPRAGDTKLTVQGDLSGWQPGATIVLPDTNELPTSEAEKFIAGTIPTQWEQAAIDHVSGNQVFLKAPLQYDHLGSTNVDPSVPQQLPEVALLDRNVVIRSENPHGTRGTTMFAAGANVDIEYARFQDLGRTSAMVPNDDTTFDASGNVTHFGTNQDDRYAVFFEHLIGPATPQNGFQFTFLGNTIDGSLKWAVALDDTSFGMLEKNVIFNAQGAGFATENGSEIGNDFLLNMTIGITGTHQDGTTGLSTDNVGDGGSGFWFARGGNMVLGNVAADSAYAGFVIDGYVNQGSVTLPKYPGADTHVASQSYTSLLNPSGIFARNEVYGMSEYGLWAALISGSDTAPNQPGLDIYGLTIWNVFDVGVWAYHTADVTFDHLTVLGNEAAQNRNDFGLVGVKLLTYENYNTVIQNSLVEGARYGVLAPRDDASTAGKLQPTIIQNSVLKNYINILVEPPEDDRGSNGNELVVNNVQFTLIKTLPVGPSPTTGIPPAANIQMAYVADNNGGQINYTESSVVKVFNYNQIPGDNFQVFYPQQMASFVMPQTDPARLYGRDAHDGLIGSPQAGLTNAQNWAQFGITTAGALAPLNAAASMPDINGLVAPIQPAPTTMHVAWVTPWNGAQVGDVQPVRLRYNVNGALPANATVYLSLDGGTPFSTFKDQGIYNVAPGPHTLTAYIGDLQGNIWPGTTASSVTFVVATPPAAPAVATESPVGPALPALSLAGLLDNFDISAAVAVAVSASTGGANQTSTGGTIGNTGASSSVTASASAATANVLSDHSSDEDSPTSDMMLDDETLTAIAMDSASTTAANPSEETPTAAG